MGHTNDHHQTQLPQSQATPLETPPLTDQPQPEGQTIPPPAPQINPPLPDHPEFDLDDDYAQFERAPWLDEDEGDYFDDDEFHHRVHALP